MAGSTVDPDIPIGEYHLRVSQKPVTQPSQPFDGAATQTGTETLTNKTLTSPVLTTPTLTSGGDVVGTTATQTLTNKTVTGGTVNPTTLQQGGVQAVTISGTQSLTNKTITLPTIIAPTVAGGGFDSPTLTDPVISSTGFYYAQHDHSAANKGGTLSTYETVRSWDDYTPEWTAVTTNPTLGTGATAQGRYKIIGYKTVQVDIEFKAGTSGFAGGSGTYCFSLPNAYNGGVVELGYGYVRGSSVESIGSARMYDSSTYIYYTGVSVAASNANYLLVYTNQAATGAIRPTQPFTWSTGDQINISCTYEFQ